MPVRNWQQLRPTNFSDALRGQQVAGQSFNAGFENMRSAGNQVTAMVDERIGKETAANDQTIQAGLERLQSLGDYNQAEETGQLGVESLGQTFGNRYSTDAADKAKIAAKSRLMGEATSQAFGVGEQVARKGMDITAAHKAVYDSLVGQGASVQEAMTGADQFNQKSEGLKQEFAKTRTDNADAFTQQLIAAGKPLTSESINSAVAGADRNTIDVIALKSQLNAAKSSKRADVQNQRKEAQHAGRMASMQHATDVRNGVAVDDDTHRKGLSPDAQMAYDQNIVSDIDSAQNLTQEQHRQLAVTQADLQLDDDMVAQKEDQEVASFLATYNALPDPHRDLDKAEQFFGQEELRSGKSVVERISDDTTLFRGDASKDITAMVDRLSAGRERSEVSSLVGLAYLDTKAQAQGFWTQGVAFKAMEKNVKARLDQMSARTAAHKTYTDAQGAAGTAVLRRKDALLTKMDRRARGLKQGKSYKGPVTKTGDPSGKKAANEDQAKKDLGLGGKTPPPPDGVKEVEKSLATAAASKDKPTVNPDIQKAVLAIEAGGMSSLKTRARALESTNPELSAALYKRIDQKEEPGREREKVAKAFKEARRKQMIEDNRRKKKRLEQLLKSN